MKITIFTKEKYTYYSRIFLPHYIANHKSKEKLILRKESWYKDRRTFDINLTNELRVKLHQIFKHVSYDN